MSVLLNGGRRFAGTLTRSHSLNQVALLNPYSQLSQVRLASEDSSRGIRESWLERFFTIDHTKTAHSSAVGSQNIIYRLVFVKTIPEHNDAFVDLGSKMLGKFTEQRDDCRLIGAWQTVIGHGEEIVHLWQYKQGYKSLDDMGCDIFPNDKDFQEFQHKSRKMIKSTYSQIAMNLGYFDEPVERPEKHVYELRSYKLKPGSMIEWANHWSRGIEYRKSHNQNVAGMFTHIGELNMVHHIWAYKSFQDRNKIRKTSWDNSGWSQTVANTVPLIKNIKSRVMVSLPYSKLK